MSENAVPGRSVGLLVTALVAAEILSAFELSMLYAALRYLIDEFGNPERVGWIITCFLLASAVSAAICGRLGDIFGRQRVLLVVIAFSVVGSLISGFSVTLAGVIFGRVIQGTAGAIYPLCIGLIRENVKGSSVSVFIGLLAATMTVSAGFGALIGGMLVDHFSWRWIFFAGAFVGTVALLCVHLWIPRSPASPPKQKPNFVGGLLFAPAVTALLLGVTKGGEWGWASSLTLGCLVGGAALLAIWARSELRSASPLIDVRLLANRPVALANLAGVFIGLAAFQMLQIWSLLLQQPTATGVGLGLTATMAGLVLLPSTLVALVGGPGAGWMMNRLGGRTTMLIGGLILLCGWLAVAWRHDTVAIATLTLTVLGLGLAVYYSAIPMVIAQSVPLDRTSEAMGVMIVTRMTAMGIGAQIVASLLDSSTVAAPVGDAQFPSSSAYMLAFGYVIAGCVCCLAIAAALPGKRKPAQGNAGATLAEVR